MNAVEGLDVSVSGAVLVLALDRQERRNALTPVMLQGILDALQRAPAVGARAAVLTGRGSHFCSGADLRQLDRERERLVALSWQVIRELSEAPLPVVCALNGPAVGGGVELALSCDVRVGVRGTWLQAAGLRWGAVSCVRLARYVPLGLATQMLWLDRRLSAEEALAWGFLTAVEETRTALDTVALDVAQRLASLPIGALLRSRRLLRDAATSWGGLLDEQARASAQGWGESEVAGPRGPA